MRQLQRPTCPTNAVPKVRQVRQPISLGRMTLIRPSLTRISRTPFFVVTDRCLLGFASGLAGVIWRPARYITTPAVIATHEPPLVYETRGQSYILLLVQYLMARFWDILCNGKTMGIWAELYTVGLPARHQASRRLRNVDCFRKVGIDLGSPLELRGGWGGFWRPSDNRPSRSLPGGGFPRL